MPPFGPDQLRGNDVEMIIRFLHDDYLHMPGNESPESLAGATAKTNGQGDKP